MTKKELIALADSRILVFKGNGRTGKTLLARSIIKDLRFIYFNCLGNGFKRVKNDIEKSVNKNHEVIVVDDLTNINLFEFLVFNYYNYTYADNCTLIIIVDNDFKIPMIPSFSRKIKVIQFD